jgi:hypothetical protein
MAAAAVLCLAAILLVFSSAPASAAGGHSVLRTFSTGPNTDPRSLATDSDGNVYVLDVGARRIDKFDSAGNRIPFSGTATYIGETALTGSAGGPFDIASWTPSGIAVDRSGGPEDGNIYFARTEEQSPADFFVFDPSGINSGQLGPRGSYYCNAAVNQATGEVYVADQGNGTIRRYPAPAGNPNQVAPNGQLNLSTCYSGIAVDSTGALYTGSSPVQKYDASQFGAASPVPSADLPVPSNALAVDPSNDDVYANDGSQIVRFNSAGVQQGVPFGNLSGSRGVTTGVNGNVLATDSGGGVFVYGAAEIQLPTATTGGSTHGTAKSADVEGAVDPDGAGNITACEIRYGEDSGYSDGSVPCAPGGPISSPTAVTATLTGLVSGTTYRYRVFVTNASGTQMASSDQTFTTPVAIEGATTGPAAEVKKDSADLTGSYTGSGQETHYFFEWGATSAYGHTTPLPPGASAGNGSGTQNVAPVHISGLRAATTYHYRLVVSDASGISRGQNETFKTAEAVTGLTADPATAITNNDAVLHASFDGDSTYETRYYFEWGPGPTYGNVTPPPPGTAVPAGGGRIQVPAVQISGLQQGATYHYRVIASNAVGTSVSPSATFKTAEAPIIGSVLTRNVTASSAELAAEINPRLGHTTYHFEWGPTTNYGNVTPVPEGDAGSGTSPVPVSAQIDGLTAGITYHFRLVATSQYGTTQSPDQSFGFYPPNCPNAQLRQETTSNSLPDCRAYELVTPSFQQGAFVMPRAGENSGLATNPSRVSYGAALGTFPEDSGDPVNLYADLYVSTRSDTGWHQKYIGPPGNTTASVGGPPMNWMNNYNYNGAISAAQDGTQLSPSLDKAIDYDRGYPSYFGQLASASNAPFVWDTTTGNFLERWPTNLGQVAGGEDFVGVPRASTDFSHFVFSSNVVFAPGGEPSDQHIECCPPEQTGPYPGPPKASVYDNDLKTGTVKLASLKGNGVPFQGFVFDISEGGSHILMAEESNSALRPPQNRPGSNTPVEVLGPLYLRVDGAHTYEIAAGHRIRYVDSTADGETVYLTSKEQLTPDDQDTSSDLFVWHQSKPGVLSRVSVGSGGGAGNFDSCSATWISDCGVGLIEFGSYADAAAGEGGNALTDSFLAKRTGDIYFLSPEQLIPGQGQPDLENLYLFREGTVRFVAALEVKSLQTELTRADTAVARMQVTPDGAHMAFITNTHLTGFDSGEYGQMFTYDPRDGRITCASCRRDGQPATSEVFGSQNGLFQTYDGRVAFSTEDPLAPRDTNEAEDTYEYTEGRPFLISSGLAPGLPPGPSGLVGVHLRPGLVGVSANGTDVYFATFETLVTQDHNGRQLKMYDARTGGGFPAEREVAPCAAADECHGPSSTAPALPPDRTSANLGKTAKPKPHKAKKKHKQAKKKHQQAKKHKKRAAKNKGKRKAGNGNQGRNQRG